MLWPTAQSWAGAGAEGMLLGAWAQEQFTCREWDAQGQCPLPPARVSSTGPRPARGASVPANGIVYLGNTFFLGFLRPFSKHIFK